MTQAPLLVRFTELERKVVRNAASKGIVPRVSETAFIRAASVMFALAMEDKRGVELIAELNTHLTRKHRSSAAHQLADAIKVFGA